MASRWKALAPWLAPLVLCGVATAQLFLARSTLLSPWKGGGFGMFSTVDSPSARFLRIHLVTPEGEIPALVPDDLRAKERQLRTTGSQELARELAQSLAAGTWVRLRLASAIGYYRQLLLRGGDPGTYRELATELGPFSRPDARAVDLGSLDFVRMLRPDESPAPGDTTVRVSDVWVEAWRYAFDAQAPSLTAEMLFAVRAHQPRD